MKPLNDYDIKYSKSVGENKVELKITGFDKILPLFQLFNV